MSFRFINHACIEVDFGAGTMVTDPWFSGRVFNNSWELIVDGGEIDYHRIRYIWISHEHPDHLHFPTLRAIREATTGPITVLFRRQKDRGPAKAIAALGFELLELDHGSRLEIADNLAVTCYANRTDSTLLIESDGQRIFNQNDCRLPLATLRQITRVDFWLFQFSIAGYAGNQADEAALDRAGAAHTGMIAAYASALRPAVLIPFASFVRFCHPLNEFLNRWRVTPDAVAALDLPCTTLILKPGEGPGDDDGPAWWRSNFTTQTAPAVLSPFPDDDLVKAGQRFSSAIRKAWPRWTVPRALSIELFPGGRYAVLDLRLGQFFLSESIVGRLVASIDPQSLAFLLRFPWGADTIHIAGIATVLDQLHWRWLLYIKHAEYKLIRLGRLRSLVPLPLAWLRTRQ